jgi:hypothetical protein
MDYTKSQEPLRSRYQTADEIKRLIRTFANDLDNIKIRIGSRLVPLSSLSFESYFDYIKNLPYRRDAAPVEQVGRPMWIMEKKLNGRDCKKAAIMICAYLQLKRVPWRLLGSSCRRDGQIHHIFPQAKLAGFADWVNVDATYSDYEIGQAKTVTAMEVL